MKSEWRITCNYLDDERIYHVYRLRNINEVDHSGNREYVPHFTTKDRDEAVKMAEKMNGEESK